jgi:hypothetical protein
VPSAIKAFALGVGYFFLINMTVQGAILIYAITGLYLLGHRVPEPTPHIYWLGVSGILAYFLVRRRRTNGRWPYNTR